MGRLRLIYNILRYLGPGFVLRRGAMSLARRLGAPQRVYAPRAWQALELSTLLSPGVPRSPAEFAQFKRDTAPAFVFTLGRPPQIPENLRAAPPLHEPPDAIATAQPARFERVPSLAERVALLKEMRPVYLFHWPSPAPIDWNVNALQQTRCAPGLNWFDYPDFLATQGDARTFWDPARAAWALDLLRAPAHGVSIEGGALFWRWLDSFMQACPPFRGFHWKCGQESSVRFIALALAFWATADDPASTPERFVDFARLAWATGYRVHHHIDYAVSQKNNHALSEACGLMLVSHLFPEFRESPRWMATGRRVLTQEVRKQFYADGSYIQHSMNYQRVALHGVLLAMRIAELAGRPFERELYACMQRCAEFLYQMMEPGSGRLPQYGNNDGANVLALSECDFNDFRPAIQCAHFLATRTRRLAPGPWDEELLWLFGEQALSPPRETADAAAAPCSSRFDAGGYYTLRAKESWAMIRCHRYRDRPAHVDPLHLDLWWHGVNVLRDCGTFRYFTPENPRLELYFKSIAAHNTIELDDAEPLELASRFLWFPWPAARCLSYDAQRLEFTGESRAYDRRPWHVRHRREIRALPGECWVIRDELLGAGQHRACLRWHLFDGQTQLDLQRNTLSLLTPAGSLYLSILADTAVAPTALQDSGETRAAAELASPQRVALSLHRGVETPHCVQGWEAPYYSQRRPIPVLEARLSGPLPLRLTTILSPRPLEPADALSLR